MGHGGHRNHKCGLDERHASDVLKESVGEERTELLLYLQLFTFGRLMGCDYGVLLHAFFLSSLPPSLRTAGVPLTNSDEIVCRQLPTHLSFTGFPPLVRPVVWYSENRSTTPNVHHNTIHDEYEANETHINQLPLYAKEQLAMLQQ